MASIGSLVVDLTANTGSFETDIGRAAKAADKRAQEINRSIAKIGTAVSVAAGTAAAGLVSLVKHSLESADQLNKLSQSSGVSVENLSALKLAASQSGVGIDSLATGLKKLNVAISEAAGNSKSEAAVAFKALGIAVKDASGQTKSADQVLSAIAGKFAGYEDGANKTAIAVKLFGKAGEELIPLLNEGSDGLKNFTDQAQRAGLVISGETAKAAEEFNDKLSLLKATLTEGVGNKIAAQLLPNLNALADTLLETANNADTLNHIATVSATGLKILADVGLTVAKTFDDVGSFIGALAAQLGALATGNFRALADIQKALTEDIEKSDEAFQKRIAAIWRDGGDDLLAEVKITAKKIKEEAPNIAGAAEIAKGVESAIQKLTEFKQNLLEQVATFGLGEAAAIKYRLEFGNLSDELKKAGAAGDALKTGILAAGNFKQVQVDTKALADAFADVNAQILELTGNTVGATLARFDKQNEELAKTIARNGTEADTERLKSLRDLIQAQAEYNALQLEAQRIQDELAQQEQRITNDQIAGVTTDLDALKKLDDARSDAVRRLDEIHDRQVKIAEESGNPALIDGAKKFGAEIENLAAQTNLLGQKLKSTFEDAASGPFADFITGAKSAGDAVKDFAQAFEREIAQLIAKDLIGRLFKALGGVGGTSGGGGSGTGWLSAIAGLFGGARATGGPVNSGSIYRVNEREPEFFKPNIGGNVIPLSKMTGMGGSTIVNVSVAAPAGTVSTETRQQVGNSVAGALARSRNRFG